MMRQLLTLFALILFLPIYTHAQKESDFIPVDWKEIKKVAENDPQKINDQVARMAASEIDTTMTWNERILAYYGQSYLTPMTELSEGITLDKLLKDGKYEDCAFYHLTCTGCMHSGDIREIPEMVGTAEYIELSLPDLRMADAKYVIFSCNAYSNGALSPNLTVGWMNCKHDMTISEDGVAYDPSCVQHMVRVGDKDLAKGIVFGILDVVSSEIVWLETPNSDQVLSWINHEDVINFMLTLDQKMKIGEVLDIKANAQGLTKVDSPEEADEAYTSEWALDPAKVSLLLLT